MSDTGITAGAPAPTPPAGGPTPPAVTAAIGPDPDALAAEVEKWKGLARKHEGNAKSNADAAKELERLRAEGMTEQEKAVANARREAAAEAMKSVDARLVAAEVRAAAGGRLADPADAVRLIDLSQFQAGDGGEVDGKAVSKAIDQLLKEKPYLAAGGAGRPSGSADGGARGGPGAPGDMNAWLRKQAGRQ